MNIHVHYFLLKCVDDPLANIYLLPWKYPNWFKVNMVVASSPFSKEIF